VIIDNVDDQATIYYQLDDADFKEYKQPITITNAAMLKMYAKKNGVKSTTIETQFYKIDPNLSIDLGTDYAQRYNGGGDNALIDGIKGTNDYRTGTWQGYHNKDVEITLDLGSEKIMNTVEVGFLNDQRTWIFLPTEVSFMTSTDGKNFKTVNTVTLGEVVPVENPEIKYIGTKLASEKIRYIKVISKTLGALPEWHLGHSYNGRSWIFMDEVIIN